MSLACVNPAPKLASSLAEDGAFADTPLRVVDCGARDGFEAFWTTTFGDHVSLLGFEPDAAECERLNGAFGSPRRQYFPCALHADRGTRSFYVTTFPPSCGFYEPDALFWQRFADRVNLAVRRVDQVDTRDLTSVLLESGDSRVDFMKLDTEGCELDILRGADSVLRNSVIGLSIEVEFSRVHLGQPLQSDVDQYLRGFGFELMDLSTYRHSRLALPLSLEPHHSGRGQMLWGQALYMRDPVKELASPDSHAAWDPSRLLRAAGLFDLFSLQDCAAEVVQHSAAHGLLAPRAAERYLDLAASSAAGRDTTYARYMGERVADALPGFLASAADSWPDLAGAVLHLLRQLGAGEFERGLSAAVELLAFLPGVEATTTQEFEQQLVFEHLVKHREEVLAVCSSTTSLRFREWAPAAWDRATLRAHIRPHLEGRSRMRLACYGAGEDFAHFVRDGVFGLHDVVGVVDNFRRPGEIVEGVPVFRLGELASVNPEAVVVTSARWASDLRLSAVRWLQSRRLPIAVV